MSQRPWLAFVLIAVAIIAVYFPSLKHVPRSDQIIYLYEVSQQHDWSTLSLKNYDLNRRGTFAQGDERLFRPVVYFILGLEKYFFGYRWEIWQAFGVLLHIIVSGLLLRLLWLIQPGVGAFLGALFFALLTVNMEMVIFSHVNSYMVFVALMFMALHEAYQIVVNQREELWRTWLMGLALTVACFTHETANINVVLMVMFLIGRDRKRWYRYGAILCAPVAFLILNILNFQHNPQNIHPMIVGHEVSRQEFFKPLGWWIFGGIFQQGIGLYFSGRNMIVDQWQPDFSTMLIQSPITWVIIMVLSIMVFSLVMGIYQRTKQPRQHNFFYLILIISLLLSAVIAIGRGSSQGVENVIRHNLHYFYLGWSFVIVAIYVAFEERVLPRLLKIALTVGVIILIGANALRLYQMNDLQAKGSGQTRELLAVVEQTVKAHQYDKEFSFDIADDFPGNYPYNDVFHQHSSLVEMLYPQYINHAHPQVRFDARIKQSP